MSQPSDTPETDTKAFLIHGNISSGFLVTASFARELERQRNEAREDAENLFKYLTYVTEQGLDVGGTCLWLHKDSDSAKAILENARKALAAHEALTAKN